MADFDRTVELDVTGMTCSHCVAHVREELAEIPGVANVDVILRKETPSLVTVVVTEPVSDDLLKAAVDEAGYEVAAIRRDA
ncbi:heavy metal transporter [Boudabousia liubingyangii]|uniref:heavy-metal-associated domain-containing protein n=1 Tax=Boudabousia liubingyangii TaxID=1921764 RepID=UPI00093C17E4|nr:heavy-metal-associated domain-containing protein [Boudabousia liubingyangii]OKL46760.1 heavy metal transporter [Boudabousia liubingyangii]